jgi:hypothetical protein
VTSGRAVSRRRMLTVVLGGSALAVTACGVPEALRKPPGLSASVRTLRASITAEQALVDSYSDVVRRFPQLSTRLNSFLTQHQQHLAQLRGRLVVPPHVTMSPIPSPVATSPAPSAASSAEAAVELLIRAEQTAAAAQLGRLKGAPPALAQLLASIAASEATHAVALTSGGS